MISLLSILKEEIRGTYAFIQHLDDQTMGVVQEGLSLLWDDLHAFFSGLLGRS